MENLTIYEGLVASGRMVEVSKDADFIKYFTEMGYGSDEVKEWGIALEKLLEFTHGKAFFTNLELHQEINIVFLAENGEGLDLKLKKKGEILPVELEVSYKKEDRPPGADRPAALYHLEKDLKQILFASSEPGYAQLILSSEDGGRLEFGWDPGVLKIDFLKCQGMQLLCKVEPAN